jgi:acyl-coenzyme A synthetase/AMP-(fatty) acid ligase
LTSSDVISTLLERTGGKAVVVESEWLKNVNVSQPSLPAVDTRALDVNNLPLPPVWLPASGDDTVMIFHSSGSTSGMPKPIDITARWLNFNIQTSQDIFEAIYTDGRRSVMSSK